MVFVGCCSFIFFLQYTLFVFNNILNVEQSNIFQLLDVSGVFNDFIPAFDATASTTRVQVYGAGKMVLCTGEKSLLCRNLALFRH